VTHYEVLKTFAPRGAAPISLLRLRLETGRTHQIRVHAQHAGHPVAGDEKYGDAAFNELMRDLGLRRMFLHASSVSFNWPQGAEFSINTPLPPDLGAVLDRLAGQKKRPVRGSVRVPGSRRSAARPRAR
jgi:23S rRNA pseudouridine955/2504/2580 synthase